MGIPVTRKTGMGKAGGLALAIVLLGSTGRVARAGTETFGNFGEQPNTCPTIPHGVCAAAAAINSFIFLENQYPGKYGNMLTPGVQGQKPNQTDPNDLALFGNLFYSGPSNDDLAGWNNYADTKANWFNTHAPG